MTAQDPGSGEQPPRPQDQPPADGPVPPTAQSGAERGTGQPVDAGENIYAQRAASDGVGPALKRSVSFLRPSEWGGAAAIAGATYGVMLLVSVLLGIIVSLMIGGAAEGGVGSAFGVDDLLEMVRDHEGGYLVVALIVQLTAMGLGGRFHLRISGEGGDHLITGSLGYAPLLTMVLGALALFLGSRMLARRQARRGERSTALGVWLASLVTAAMLTVLAVLLSLILAGRVTDDSSYEVIKLRFSAVSPGLFFIPLIFGTLLGVWGRRSGAGSQPTPVSDRVHRWVPGLAVAGRLTGLYLAAMAVLCLLVVALNAAADEESAVMFFAALLFAGFGAADLLALLHLSGVSASGALAGSHLSETAYLWSGDAAQLGSRWTMLLWIPMVLGLVALAFAWAGRRPVLNRGTSWIPMPAVFLLAGCLLLWAGRLSFSAEAYGWGGGRFHLAASWWTPFVFLIWGVLVEVAARFAVPRLAASVPEGRFRRLLIGAPAPVAFTAAAAGSAAPAGPSETVGASAGQAPAVGGEPTRPLDAADAAGGSTASAVAPNAAANAAAPNAAAETAGTGQAAAAPASAAPAAGLPEAQPLSPRARKRLKLSGIIAGALVLLLVLAFAGVKIANATVYSPKHVVEDYFNAVVDGDAAGAVDLIDPNVPSAERALLEGDVYGDATKKITEYDIKEVEVAEDGESATATVSVTQDQRSTDTTVQLVRAGGVLGLRQWEIDPDQPGLYKTVEVSLPQGQDTLTVNGHEVKVPAAAAPSSSASSGYGGYYEEDGDGDALSLTVLPGEYTFAAPEGGKYLTFGEDQKVTVTADEDSSSTVRFEERLTEQAVTDATQQAKDKLDACVAVKEFEIPACGLEYYRGGDDEDYRNPSWTVEKYPEFVVSDGTYGSSQKDADQLDPHSRLYVSTAESGKAKLTYQHRYDEDDDWDDQDYSATLSGAFDLKVTADELEVQDAEDSDSL